MLQMDHHQEHNRYSDRVQLPKHWNVLHNIRDRAEADGVMMEDVVEELFVGPRVKLEIENDTKHFYLYFFFFQIKVDASRLTNLIFELQLEIACETCLLLN